MGDSVYRSIQEGGPLSEDGIYGSRICEFGDGAIDFFSRGQPFGDHSLRRSYRKGAPSRGQTIVQQVRQLVRETERPAGLATRRCGPPARGQEAVPKGHVAENLAVVRGRRRARPARREGGLSSTRRAPDRTDPRALLQAFLRRRAFSI